MFNKHKVLKFLQMSHGCSLPCLWVTINLNQLKVNKQHTNLFHLFRLMTDDDDIH